MTLDMDAWTHGHVSSRERHQLRQATDEDRQTPTPNDRRLSPFTQSTSMCPCVHVHTLDTSFCRRLQPPTQSVFVSVRRSTLMPRSPYLRRKVDRGDSWSIRGDRDVFAAVVDDCASVLRPVASRCLRCAGAMTRTPMVRFPASPRLSMSVCVCDVVLCGDVSLWTSVDNCRNCVHARPNCVHATRLR